MGFSLRVEESLRESQSIRFNATPLRIFAPAEEINTKVAVRSGVSFLKGDKLSCHNEMAIGPDGPKIPTSAT